VDVLPSRIAFPEAWAMRPASAGQLWGLVGVGGDTLAGLAPDLAVGVPCFTVAGPAKSGRSTILLSMAQSFLAGRTSLILVTPRPSPLRALEHAPGVAAVFSGGADLDEEELRAALSAVSGPAVVMIDDAELLRNCDASGELSRIISFGGDSGQALVFGGDAEGLGLGFSGWQVDAKRARRGCLTAPATLPEGDLIGIRLAHSMLGQASRPGRCLLNVGDGRLTTVTVPTAGG
jgi:S-DNA-T family DNA segregation ATPase FtsK/SpoIIIE